MAEGEDLSNEQLPLQGVVLCCTHLSQDVKTKLTEAALQMGAIHKLDLTSDVTHLIVGSIITPKYRYTAKDRPDIKVLLPTWIDAMRVAWMDGGDVDVEGLEQEHKVPPFAGLQICVTGFENVQDRNKIAHAAEAHGASYHPDLTKACTHLVCRKPEGAKYKAAKSWELHVVSLKWFEDSLCRGMALDEKLYDPNLPVEEQGIGAFKRHPKPRTSLGKHGRDDSAHDAGKKKLRRTASSRLESQSQDMWQDISVQSVSSRRSDADQWKEEDEQSDTLVSETTYGLQHGQEAARRSIQALSADATEAPSGLFAGSQVLIHGFEHAKTELLQQYLEPNGARVAQSLTELEAASHDGTFHARYLLVPHASSPPISPPPEVPSDTVVVTEWWVERCIHYKRAIDPATDSLSRPLADAFISAFSNLAISTTGFAGVDLRQVAEAVKLMGATYQEKVLPSSSVLISGSASIRKEKAFYAQKHHISVVSADWLWECLESKKQVPFDRFLVSLPALDARDFPGEPSAGSPAPSDLQQGSNKEAGKVKDGAASRRLSNTRSKHATPTLSLQTSKNPPTTVAPKPWPILHEDNDESGSFDSELLAAPTTKSVARKTPQPLQEVSPNLSPRKTIEPFEEDNEEDNEDEPSKIEPRSKTLAGASSPRKPASPRKSPQKATTAPDNTSLQPPEQQNLADLASLLNRKGTSRPNSAPAHSPEKRKKRPLGRAPSGISNRSNSGNLSPALQAEVPESLEADGYNAAAEAPLPPSTQLGYETPEAEAHRLQMSKKMGTKLQDDHGMKRVASVGTVKDMTPSSEAGVSGRVRGKGRAK